MPPKLLTVLLILICRSILSTKMLERQACRPLLIFLVRTRRSIPRPKDAWEAVGVYSEDVVVETVDEVFPGSMIYASSVVGTIPEIGPRNLVIELDAGQTLSVIVDADPGVIPSIDIFDPAGTLLESATATGTRVMVNILPIVAAGEYTVEIDSASANNGGFEAQICSQCFNGR